MYFFRRKRIIHTLNMLIVAVDVTRLCTLIVNSTQRLYLKTNFDIFRPMTMITIRMLTWNMVYVYTKSALAPMKPNTYLFDENFRYS